MNTSGDSITLITYSMKWTESTDGKKKQINITKTNEQCFKPSKLVVGYRGRSN